MWNDQNTSDANGTGWNYQSNSQKNSRTNSKGNSRSYSHNNNSETNFQNSSGKSNSQYSSGKSNSQYSSGKSNRYNSGKKISKPVSEQGYAQNGQNRQHNGKKNGHNKQNRPDNRHNYNEYSRKPEFNNGLSVQHVDENGASASSSTQDLSEAQNRNEYSSQPRLQNGFTRRQPVDENQASALSTIQDLSEAQYRNASSSNTEPQNGLLVDENLASAPSPTQNLAEAQNFDESTPNQELDDGFRRFEDLVGEPVASAFRNSSLASCTNNNQASTCESGVCRQCIMPEVKASAQDISEDLTNSMERYIQEIQTYLELLRTQREDVDQTARDGMRRAVATMDNVMKIVEIRQNELIHAIERAGQEQTKILNSKIFDLEVLLPYLSTNINFLDKTRSESPPHALFWANHQVSHNLQVVPGIMEDAKPRIIEAPIGFNIRTDWNACIENIASVGSPNLVQLEVPKTKAYLQAWNEAKGRPIFGTSNIVMFKPPRYYQDSFIFGSRGQEDGQFNRPWGICCDNRGNFIVADRANHRVQVFTSQGAFLFKFGSEGSQPGQFKLPSGVCCDSKNRIIVVDKDNHRVQVFQCDGTYMFNFGGKGSGKGQFDYPWDVTCNSICQIVVSDTRNHRIQLFTEEGEYLAHFTFGGTPQAIRQLDHPRGVCFNPDGNIICTDFNNHRVLCIKKDLQGFYYVFEKKKEEKYYSEFLRPSGVIADDAGNFVITDNRHGQIKVFNKRGGKILEFGREDVKPFSPLGVCLTPEGRIAVIDGNSVIVF